VRQAPGSTGAEHCFGSPDVAELTIELATEGSSARWLFARLLRHDCDHGSVQSSLAIETPLGVDSDARFEGPGRSRRPIRIWDEAPFPRAIRVWDRGSQS
jgi:hypothetical protein